MVIVQQFISILSNTPVLVSLFSIISLASVGKSLGVRRAYAKVLLKIFEYGRQNIENVRKRTQLYDKIESDDEHHSISKQIHEEDQTKLIPSIDSVDGNKLDCEQEHKLPDSISTQRIPDQNSIQLDTNEINAISNVTALKLNSVCNDKKYLQQHQQHNNCKTVISRDALILLPEGGKNTAITDSSLIKSTRNSDIESSDTESEPTFDFHLGNCLDYIKSGVEAIIEDDVTSRFEAEELKNWNLLTRTNRYYEFISWRLSIIWVFGFFIRYFVLMPFRVIICFVGVVWLTICTAAVGCVPDGETKRKMVQKVLIQCFIFLSSALSAVINYHDIQNRPATAGICVANHTSPIDVLVLMCDNCYSLIGQSHGGFLGVLQRALARASPHIWFERAESKDRMAVAERLRLHVSDPKNPPILIFPEGTCINNTSVMQFKKGSFEVGGVIYPVAIKYDPRFGDPFWNSSKYSMMQYLFLMMTSWAIVCDVWYLPPMYQQEGESAIVFANRVKGVIAQKGGLVDLSWDGNLKRNKPKNEWKEKQQEEFSKRLKGESA